MTSAENEGFIFLSNHDSQRERWKPDRNDQPSGWVTAYCTNLDTELPGSSVCAPIYKHGQQYNLAQRFMLAWPWGNNLRVISTYAFKDFNEGPPLELGQDPNVSESRRVHVPPWPFGGYPSRCKASPAVSPVAVDWDNDTAKPWVCEHRWNGMFGMVHFRRHIWNFTVHHVHRRLDDHEGHLAYSIGESAFVALSRGYSWFTGHGPNTTFDLTNVSTGLPQGSYCNLANRNSQSEIDFCENSRIDVDINGTIAHGLLPAGEMVAIHVSFKASGRLSQKRIETLVV